MTEEQHYKNPEIIEDDDEETSQTQQEETVTSNQLSDMNKEKEANLPSKMSLPLPAGDNRVAPRDALNYYLREINKFPPLKENEEFELAQRIRENNDQDAALRLVTSHLRLVVKIAMDFQKKWMNNVLELIQEGNIGLMKAVQKFNPDRGIKFSYYAAFWIKAYILKFIMDNWRMVKIGTTQSQRKLFYNLGKEKQRLENLGFDPNAETLSKNLDVSEEDIVEMSQRMGQHDVSLDIPYGEDSSTTKLDMLPALEQSVENKLAREEVSENLQKHLKTIIPQLNEKEKEILNKRLLESSPVTLRDIGDKYGITRERVRQIESRLLEKLRKHLSNEIKDFSSDWITYD